MDEVDAAMARRQMSVEKRGDKNSDEVDCAVSRPAIGQIPREKKNGSGERRKPEGDNCSVKKDDIRK
jgi:hypothetical protein